MWDNFAQIHGGDKNLFRAKKESLRGKFDDMRMKEGEIIAWFCGWIKEVVKAIRGDEADISNEAMINKVLRTLLHICIIRVSIIK